MTEMTTIEILKKAKQCKTSIAASSNEQRNNALIKMAEALKVHCDEIITANSLDISNATGKISPVMIDRLTLNK